MSSKDHARPLKPDGPGNNTSSTGGTQAAQGNSGSTSWNSPLQPQVVYPRQEQIASFAGVPLFDASQVAISNVDIRGGTFYSTPSHQVYSFTPYQQYPGVEFERFNDMYQTSNVTATGYSSFVPAAVEHAQGIHNLYYNTNEDTRFSAQAGLSLFDNTSADYTEDWVSQTSQIPPEMKISPDHQSGNTPIAKEFPETVWNQGTGRQPETFSAATGGHQQPTGSPFVSQSIPITVQPKQNEPIDQQFSQMKIGVSAPSNNPGQSRSEYPSGSFISSNQFPVVWNSMQPQQIIPLYSSQDVRFSAPQQQQQQQQQHQPRPHKSGNVNTGTWHDNSKREQRPNSTSGGKNLPPTQNRFPPPTQQHTNAPSLLSQITNTRFTKAPRGLSQYNVHMGNQNRNQVERNRTVTESSNSSGGRNRTPKQSNVSGSGQQSTYSHQSYTPSGPSGQPDYTAFSGPPAFYNQGYSPSTAPPPAFMRAQQQSQQRLLASSLFMMPSEQYRPAFTPHGIPSDAIFQNPQFMPGNGPYRLPPIGGIPPYNMYPPPNMFFNQGQFNGPRKNGRGRGRGGRGMPRGGFRGSYHGGFTHFNASGQSQTFDSELAESVNRGPDFDRFDDKTPSPKGDIAPCIEGNPRSDQTTPTPQNFESTEKEDTKPDVTEKPPDRTESEDEKKPSEAQ